MLLAKNTNTPASFYLEQTIPEFIEWIAENNEQVREREENGIRK